MSLDAKKNIVSEELKRFSHSSYHVSKRSHVLVFAPLLSFSVVVVVADVEEAKIHIARKTVGFVPSDKKIRGTAPKKVRAAAANGK